MSELFEMAVKSASFEFPDLPRRKNFMAFCLLIVGGGFVIFFAPTIGPRGSR